MNFVYEPDKSHLMASIPKMQKLISEWTKISDEIPDEEQIHICSCCWKVTKGKKAIEENVSERSDSPTGRQYYCRVCNNTHGRDKVC